MKALPPLYYLILILFISCTSDDGGDIPHSETLYFPPVQSEDWQTMSIEEAGWNTDKVSELKTFLEIQNTKAFIILKNGKIVIEEYFNDFTKNDSHFWFSAGKTLTAFTIGIANEEGLIDLNSSSALYLQSGWSSLTPTEESLITVKHHLTMTTGLDYNITNTFCTDPECLTYLNPSGSFWYYHNAPYTLLSEMISSVYNAGFDTYFDEKIKSKTGMDGSWLTLGYNKIYYSTARSMARFGLLNLNKGVWGDVDVLQNQVYFNEMTTPSQNLNPSYGYLWWLNGQTSFRLPGSEIQYDGKLIPNAPDDLIAGLGKDDQKLYVIPSENLVIVRLGDAADQSLLGPSGFDNELWAYINALTN
ncbi:MAG: serine hydrolase [Aquimarina sp.]|nr:serine hydrolase [Aquimarina sp.]